MSSGPSNARVTFGEALRYWIKLGFINFGGPAGQIALMHRDLVDGRRWIPEADYLRALNFCMLLPGPEAQQLATYVGWRLHRTWGGVMAGLWFILPSVLVLWALSWSVAAYGDVTVVAGLLYGVQPVVIAIVAEAVIRIGRRTLHHWSLAVLAAGAFLALSWFRLPFPLVIALAAGVGALLGKRWPNRVRSPESGPTTGPRPAPSYPPLKRALTLAPVFLALWLVPVGALILWQGLDSIYAREALFFTGAAFVTFGGAYAVLSFVADAAVNTYGWLEPGQMIQGLALAESTPGPLIMVLQYVGFLAAWRAPGELSPLLGGTLGALIVTYVTFLPSFMFILVGAPYIEALAGNRRLQTALVGVTAAVVGVILNLAVFFGSHVLFPQNSTLDLFAASIAVAAFLLLQRLRWQVLLVLALGAASGLAWVGTGHGLGV